MPHLGLDNLEFRSPVVVYTRQDGKQFPLYFTPVWERRLKALWAFIDGLSGVDGRELLLGGGIPSEAGIDAQAALLGGSPPAPSPQELALLMGDAPQPLFKDPIRDTRANRANYPAAAYQNILYVETDSASDLVYQSDGTNWIYVVGIYREALANLLTGLGTSDTGLLFEVTDYDHVLQWTGAAWTWGPGEIGSGYYQLYEDAPNTIGVSAWQICDGTAVDRLNADGTVTNVTTPNLTTAAYLKGGITSAAVAAAGGLTTAVSGGTPAGTNSAPVFTGDAANSVANAAVGTDPAVIHPYTPTGTVSAPTFTGSALAGHTHGPSTLELRNKQARLYYRR